MFTHLIPGQKNVAHGPLVFSADIFDSASHKNRADEKFHESDEER